MLLGSPLLYHWVPREAPCYMLMSYISCLTITVEMEAERLNSLPKSQICYRDFYRRFLFKSVTLHMCALSLHLRQFLLGHSSWQCPHGHLCAHLRLSVQISEPIIEKLQPGCLPGSTATGAWKYTGLSRVNSTTVHNSMPTTHSLRSLWRLFSVSFPRASRELQRHARLSGINLHTPHQPTHLGNKMISSPWRKFLITITFLSCSIYIFQ